ncbi:hypothetical protein WA026_010966 [Henosepilachna vigintioctopunctata]|uniref:XRN2-binding (XTBD) domain-containing protein n=1 Tax=Henosepilachna vigintioctopunctata TaxID=420089 RepID=A0AAW1UX55_9CUCU
MGQCYPADWDVDDYRDDTEPEQHWLLRKEFMCIHKGEFSEDYLVALAIAFAKIEFMGCVYRAPLMIRISKLSEDVAKQYREIKKTKLQNTFVTASCAAVSEAKRRSDLGPERKKKSKKILTSSSE